MGNLCPVFLPWSIDVAIVMLIFMHLGVCTRNMTQGYRAAEKYNNKLGLLLLLISVAIFLFTAKNNGSVNVSLSNYGRSLILFCISATLGSELTIILSRKISTLHNNSIRVYLKFLGKNSMDIYGLHMLLDTVMVHFVNKIIVVTGMANYDGILRSGVVSLAFVLPVSGAGYLFILMKKRLLRVTVTANEK